MEKNEPLPEYHFLDLQTDLLECIVSALRDQKISNAELARRLKCSRSYICKLLKGNQNLTILKLYEISRALNVEIEISFGTKRQ